MTLDPRAIAELEQRLADLSEWTTGGATPIGTSSMWPAVFCGLDREPVAYCQTDQLAQIITTMRNLLPDLLRERRELRAQVLERMASQFIRTEATPEYDRVIGPTDWDTVGNRWDAWNESRPDHAARQETWRRDACWRCWSLLNQWAKGIRAGRIA